MKADGFIRFIFIIALVAMSGCAAPVPHAVVSTSSAPRWTKLTRRIINHTAFRHYATVGRNDGSSRHILIDEAALQRWQPGQPLPPEALIVIHTTLTPGQETTHFTKRMGADGYFTYGSFEPAQPSFATSTDNTCASCHDLSDDASGTYTAPLLNAAIAQGQLMTAQCNRAGRIPCESEVYHNLVPAN